MSTYRWWKFFLFFFIIISNEVAVYLYIRADEGKKCELAMIKKVISIHSASSQRVPL